MRKFFAIVLVSMFSSSAMAQIAEFPTIEQVSKRVDSLEQRIAQLELLLKGKPVAQQASNARRVSSNPYGVELAPGEILVSIDGVPVSQMSYQAPLPTVDMPSVSRSVQTPRMSYSMQRYGTCGPGGCR